VLFGHVGRCKLQVADEHVASHEDFDKFTSKARRKCDSGTSGTGGTKPSSFAPLEVPWRPHGPAARF